jgi:hypothetical protein
VPARCRQHCKRAVDIGAEIGLWILNGGNDIGASRQMENPLHALAGGNYRSNVSNICLNDLELLVCGVLAQILTPADDKTVEHADMPTVSEQTVYEVTPNEATSPRDQIPHAIYPSRCGAKNTQLQGLSTTSACATYGW